MACSLSIRSIYQSDSCNLVQGVKNGGRKEWEAVRNLYKVTADPVVQETTRNALCNVRDPQLQEETIKFAFEEGRSQVRIEYSCEIAPNNDC